jgi:hypothetical protein
VAACLPYVMLAVFVDFVHVHAAPNGGLPSVKFGGPAVTGTLDPAPQTGSSCPVCLWLRVGPRLPSQVSIDACGTDVHSEFAANTAEQPLSPIPHPAAFRGPPRPTLG